MAWTKEDRSFKTLINRRATSSGKYFYEEEGETTLEVNLHEVRSQRPPANPAVDDPQQTIVKRYDLLALTLNTRVENQQSWYAAETVNGNEVRLGDWLDTNNGAVYGIYLFDASGTAIGTTDAVQWIFHAVTGILSFNGNANAYSQPYRISGYRYVGKKGLPDPVPVEDTVYDYAQWLPNLNGTSKHTLALKFNEVDSTLALLAPERAPALTGVGMNLSVSTVQGRLPNGLPSAYYTATATSGSTVLALFVNAYALSVVNFRCGSKDRPATYGTLTLTTVANGGTTVQSRDMTLGAGTTGNVTVSNLVPYLNFWEKADAACAVARSGGGTATHTISHTEAGATAPLTLVYDDASAATSAFATSAAVNTSVDKWLSGILFLGLGSSLRLNGIVMNLYTNVYSTGNIINLRVAGGNESIAPTGIPFYNDVFTMSARVLPLNVPNEAADAPSLTLTTFKPRGNNSFSIGVPRGINTYGNVSTATAEYFYDEARRLTYSTGTAFNSVQPLDNNEAQVKNGKLEYSFDYSKDGDAYYRRVFAHVSAATTSGTLTFTGINAGAVVNILGTGIGVVLRLVTQNLYFDLGNPLGLNNGNGSGDSVANSRGGRVSTSGGVLNFTFGTNSSAFNNGEYEIYVRFTNSGYGIINSIVAS